MARYIGCARAAATEPWLEYAPSSVELVAAASETESVEKFLAGGRVEERPSLVMVIDADHEPRRKMYDLTPHCISSSVTSNVFGHSDWLDHGVNNFEQRRQRADGTVLSLRWDR